MVKTEGLVEGQERIIEALEYLLRRKRHELLREARGKESEYLFSALTLMNYLLAPSLVTKMEGIQAIHNIDVWRTMQGKGPFNRQQSASKALSFPEVIDSQSNSVGA